MRIDCPYCGERDAQEFVYRGDASLMRPESEDGMADYVYLRDNLAGPMTEHWYHAQGCRTWIAVTRDTTTHAMLGAIFARDGVR
ncbi:sarcosine oxidase subunit delta [Novosphingobium sp. AP12]|uniref:sarcosine oxidase subunit delta n=1 Tax=Novosphingobium sp. AP12 TaxID=1144305 RepID=UPI0002720561|nr:sarcosine oxidase subunit delta [Novosphingobium sp. AP12]EJL30872.1 sarcosine oxidase delta subunit [Novosphingobium sp. AP12]